MLSIRLNAIRVRNNSRESRVLNVELVLINLTMKPYVMLTYPLISTPAYHNLIRKATSQKIVS